MSLEEIIETVKKMLHPEPYTLEEIASLLGKARNDITKKVTCLGYKNYSARLLRHCF
jgi:hypothetical protein